MSIVVLREMRRSIVNSYFCLLAESLRKPHLAWVKILSSGGWSERPWIGRALLFFGPFLDSRPGEGQTYSSSFSVQTFA